MAGRKPTAAQLRDRRARSAAIGLGVLFLIVAGVQGPKLLKQLSGGSTPSAAPATVTDVTAATGAPGQASSSTGQLNAFTLLPTKDPFHSQLPSPDAQAPPTTTTTMTTPAKNTKQVTETTATQPVPKVSTTPAGGAIDFSPTSATPAGVLAAVLKMNGHRQVLTKGAGFPVAKPLFTIVKVTPKRLFVGLVTGSFADGSRLLTLRRGHRLILLNASDGSRFVFVFQQLTRAPLLSGTTIPTGSLTAPAPSTGSAVAPTATVPAPSPTSSPSPTSAGAATAPAAGSSVAPSGTTPAAAGSSG